jgi:hypothetical protein
VGTGKQKQKNEEKLLRSSGGKIMFKIFIYSFTANSSRQGTNLFLLSFAAAVLV